MTRSLEALQKAVAIGSWQRRTRMAQSGFVERVAPFYKIKTVADDKPMVPKKKALVINAAAVEVMGTRHQADDQRCRLSSFERGLVD